MIWRDSWGAFRVGPRRLAGGSLSGPLASQAFVVDDFIDVVGEMTGAGNATVLAEATPAGRSAAVVNLLTDAGATCVGKTNVDEFGIVLRDSRLHTGVVINPAAPDRDVAGASRGAAAAVAAGIVSLGIGRDTAGGLRVAAASCGLYCIRPTPSRMPMAGVRPMAPTLDSLSWVTRDLDLAVSVGRVIMNPAGAVPYDVRRLVTLPASVLDIEPAVDEAMRRHVAQIAARTGLPVSELDISAGEVAELLQHFHEIHVGEAWSLTGAWVQTHPFALAPGSAVALRLGTRLSDSDRSKSIRRMQSIAAKIQKKLASLNAVLVLPGAGELPPIASEVSAAPPQGPARPARFADAVALAGIGIPSGTVSGAPVSVSLWGPTGTDESLWALASACAVPPSKVEYAAAR